jgi:hypothetical protein
MDVEYLPEGVYLATSGDVQGLVGEADTFDELIKLVPELVEMLDELREERRWGGVIGKPVYPQLSVFATSSGMNGAPRWVQLSRCDPPLARRRLRAEREAARQPRRLDERRHPANDDRASPFRRHT